MDQLVGIFNIVQMVFILADFVLFGIFAFLLVTAQSYRPDLYPRRPNERVTTLSRSVLRDQWEAIKAHLNDKTPASLKLSIIEADKLVDHILKESGYGGEHMADRMERLASYGLQSFERLWRAHKVRNEVVHSFGYEVTEDLAARTLEDYEAFLKEVRILY